MKIGIDIDEVVADFVAKFLEFHNLRTGRNFQKNDIRTYNLWEAGILLNSREEAVMAVRKFYDSKLYDEIELVDGAKEGLERLAEAHKLVLITARAGWAREKTEKFLERYFSRLKYEIVYSGDFYPGNRGTKSEICNELGIRIYIEDNKDYALEIAEKGVIVFLFDRPWNQNHQEHSRVIRVKNWREILRRIKTID